MKPGTIVKTQDGRIGTVVYSGLDGYGIMWGRHNVNAEEILAGHGNMRRTGMPAGYQWTPDAMLRDSYPSAELPCVGEEYKIMERPE